MSRYRVRVERRQIWTIDVDAADEEEAKQQGDIIACEIEPSEDFAYATEAELRE